MTAIHSPLPLFLIGPDAAIEVHKRRMKTTHMERTVFGDALDIAWGAWENFHCVVLVRCLAGGISRRCSSITVSPRGGGDSRCGMASFALPSRGVYPMVDRRRCTLSSFTLTMDGWKICKDAGHLRVSFPTEPGIFVAGSLTGD
ncbi:hypothetical protein V8C44DRAFT_327037 [Trichoderma aethiopicum]